MDLVKLINDEGKGQTFVVSYELGSDYADYIDSLTAKLVLNSRIVILELAKITADNWSKVSDAVNDLMQKSQLRLCTFVSFGSACSITQYLALKYPKLLKTMILFDASSRAHPTWFLNLVDEIESKLPLGLPLRFNSKELDTKPFLHRLRLPTLIVTTNKASAHELNEAALLEDRIPTAWRLRLEDKADSVGEKGSGKSLADEDINNIIDFQNIPPKCSMRAKGR